MEKFPPFSPSPFFFAPPIELTLMFLSFLSPGADSAFFQQSGLPFLRHMGFTSPLPFTNKTTPFPFFFPVARSFFHTWQQHPARLFPSSRQRRGFLLSSLRNPPLLTHRDTLEHIFSIFPLIRGRPRFFLFSPFSSRYKTASGSLFFSERGFSLMLTVSPFSPSGVEGKTPLLFVLLREYLPDYGVRIERGPFDPRNTFLSSSLLYTAEEKEEFFPLKRVKTKVPFLSATGYLFFFFPPPSWKISFLIEVNCDPSSPPPTGKRRFPLFSFSFSVLVDYPYRTCRC